MTKIEAQHTPGPWTIEKGYDNTNKIVSTGCDDIPWNPHLADVWNDADARLIAGAPDLLTALVGLVNSLAEGHATDIALALGVADRAIRKATTPSPDVEG